MLEYIGKFYPFVVALFVIWVILGGHNKIDDLCYRCFHRKKCKRLKEEQKAYEADEIVTKARGRVRRK